MSTAKRAILPARLAQALAAAALTLVVAAGRHHAAAG
jgi:hypothetical protein